MTEAEAARLWEAHAGNLPWAVLRAMLAGARRFQKETDARIARTFAALYPAEAAAISLAIETQRIALEEVTMSAPQPVGHDYSKFPAECFAGLIAFLRGQEPASADLAWHAHTIVGWGIHTALGPGTHPHTPTIAFGGAGTRTDEELAAGMEKAVSQAGGGLVTGSWEWLLPIALDVLRRVLEELLKRS